jgi:hypothetical protein
MPAQTHGGPGGATKASQSKRPLTDKKSGKKSEAWRDAADKRLVHTSHVHVVCGVTVQFCLSFVSGCLHRIHVSQYPVHSPFGSRLPVAELHHYSQYLAVVDSKVVNV